MSYSNIEKLLKILEENKRFYDFDKIKRAYAFAAKLHEGQFRQSGEPYILHPVAVAQNVAQLGMDTDSICAALLHDTVEDCGTLVDLQIISQNFGGDVAMLVDGLTKLLHIPFVDKEEEHMENLRKMFLAMSKDVRVIFIKLCDRLHNMRTLSAKNDQKRRKTALETMQVYAPLAHRLGIQRIKQELENIALSYLDPIGYAEVKGDIEVKYGENRDFISSIICNWSIVLFKACVSLLIFCLVDLSIGMSGVLNSPTIIVLLLISSFILVTICLTYCGAPVLGAYIFIIVTSSSLIDPLIIM